MSEGRRMSTWLAGRKTLTPMSTSRPPLILRVTLPLTTSPSWYLEITISQARIRCAFLRERTISPVSSSMPSRRTSTASPGWGGGSSSHSLSGTRPFGLVADVDDDLVADDLDDLAGDDPADVEVLASRRGSGRSSSTSPSAVTTAVSSSSLTSNSRSRLRSTMIVRFDPTPRRGRGDAEQVARPCARTDRSVAPRSPRRRPESERPRAECPRESNREEKPTPSRKGWANAINQSS